MAKLNLKKTSKRISCRIRYKVEGKVREHNRKKRRQAKKDPFHKGRSAHKQVIQVPHICPFKDDILKEVAEVKKRKEDERLQQREVWKEEREAAKLDASSMKDLAENAESRQRVHDDLTVPDDVDDVVYKGYNADGSMKAYYKEFRKVIAASDVVLEVVDARDPLGTRCLQVEQAVLDSPGNKRLIIVLNKSDLVSRDNLDAWLKYLRRTFPTTAMKASTQAQKSKLAHRKFTPNQAVKGSNCVGAGLLMSLLANYCRNKGIKTAITVGVVGMPNVGKSSIVNSLKRSRACNVGALPGMTKTMQVVQLDSKIQLLDSPGLVMSKTTDAISALKNVVNVSMLKNPMVPATAILARANKDNLLEMYGLSDFSTPDEFFAKLALRNGRRRKGGVPDMTIAARLLVNDWNRGKIKYHTVPPEDNQDTHVSAEIVQQMAEEFNIDDVKDLESTVLRAMEVKRVDVENSTLLHTLDMDVESQPGDILPDNVSVTTGESKKKLRWRKEAKGAGKEKPDKDMKLEGNQKRNKSMRVQFKKLKKERARSLRKTDNLADVLENFSFGSEEKNSAAEAPPGGSNVAPTGGPNVAPTGGPNDAYDFNLDFMM